MVTLVCFMPQLWCNTNMKTANHTTWQHTVGPVILTETAPTTQLLICWDCSLTTDRWALLLIGQELVTVTPPPPKSRLWLLRMSPEQDAKCQRTKQVRTRWPSLFRVKGQCCLAIEISINVIPVVNVVMSCGEEVELYLVFTAKQSS